MPSRSHRTLVLLALLGCTFDACDQTVQRCRFKRDDSLCLNTIFCDGAERWLSGAATTVGLNATGGAPSEYVTSISAA